MAAAPFFVEQRSVFGDTIPKKMNTTISCVWCQNPENNFTAKIIFISFFIILLIRISRKNSDHRLFYEIS
jgi:hypothetical protein